MAARDPCPPQLHILGRQSFWMMLCALTKAPNLVFILLGLMPLRGMPARRWHLLALTILPAIAVAVLWTISSGADTATWRMVQITGENLDAFNPAVKLTYLSIIHCTFPPPSLAPCMRRTWVSFGDKSSECSDCSTPCYRVGSIRR